MNGENNRAWGEKVKDHENLKKKKKRDYNKCDMEAKVALT